MYYMDLVCRMCAGLLVTSPLLALELPVQSRQTTRTSVPFLWSYGPVSAPSRSDFLMALVPPIKPKEGVILTLPHHA
jgi:hypothetical protein